MFLHILSIQNTRLLALLFIFGETNCILSLLVMHVFFYMLPSICINKAGAHQLITNCPIPRFAHRYGKIGILFCRKKNLSLSYYYLNELLIYRLIFIQEIKTKNIWVFKLNVCLLLIWRRGTVFTLQFCSRNIVQCTALSTYLQSEKLFFSCLMRFLSYWLQK